MTITTIDGSYGEGGGQILRNACAYAAILQKDIKIVNIRAGRKVPGLRPQHLVGLRLLEAASGSCLEKGNSVGSIEIVFLANRQNNDQKRAIGFGSKSREYIGDTQTAGSISLLLQTVLPFALLHSDERDKNCDSTENIANKDESSSIRFILKGGTDTDFAPPMDYFRFVFLSSLRKTCGFDGDEDKKGVVDLSVTRRGFFPRGGGEVHATIRRPPLNAFPLPPIRLTERGEIIGITIRAFSSGNCSYSIAEKLSLAVQTMLLSSPLCHNAPIRIDISEEQCKPSSTYTSQSTTNDHGGNRGMKRPRAQSSGCGILVVAETDTGCFLGGSSIGSPKVPLEETARVAAQQVLDAIESGGCVDDYLQDQLIVYMAFAEGVSEVLTNSLTSHTRTAMWLASQMMPSVRFEVTKVGRTEQQKFEDRPKLGTSRNVSGDDETKNSESIPGLHVIRCHGIGFRPKDS